MKVMLVDGYNVIRSTSLYDDLDTADYTGRDSGLNAVREALISDVAAYAKGYYEVTIVFDGAHNSSNQRNTEVFSGIKIVFSRAGQTADTVIERLAREARDRADEVLVVTNDAALQWTVLGANVVRMSSNEFEREIKRTTSSWGDEIRAASGVSKRTLAQRLDPEVAAKLEAMLKVYKPE